MNRQEKTEKCLRWFETLKISDTIRDIKHQRDNQITDITSSSLELYHTKVTSKGIDCKQYYSIENLVELTNDWMYIRY